MKFHPFYLILSFFLGFIICWEFLPTQKLVIPSYPKYEIVPNYIIELGGIEGFVKIQANDTIYNVPFDKIEETIVNDNL